MCHSVRYRIYRPPRLRTKFIYDRFKVITEVLIHLRRPAKLPKGDLIFESICYSSAWTKETNLSEIKRKNTSMSLFAWEKSRNSC